jgi:crotonobetainyl-CoA:carnitine CoA-transferase CaiB-like acyl-CoA transferase
MFPVHSGLRVIAVEQYGAGPYGSMQLADLGAEVIKIENPADGGDMARHVGPFFFGEGDRSICCNCPGSATRRISPAPASR